MDMTHEQWVEQIRDLLLRRGGRPAMLLIHNDHGLEIVSNASDPTVLMGITRAAVLITEERFKSECATAERLGITQAMKTQISNDMQGKKVWGN